ncbi:MAG: glutamate--cysteine ligase [Sandaracinus sp.]|nr:glutamate--cysteine ligase [Sandaracinus sp.]MCB9632381.1 glutamate--cysteine ligase [Sandaracinus sp.]
MSGADDLVAMFHASEKPASVWQIGTEAEKCGVTVDGGALPFERGESPAAVRTVLERLSERHGWSKEPEYPGGPCIALRRGRASITLEPGAQLEISGAPLDTIHETAIELRGHAAELRAVSDDLNIAWLGLGFHPFAKREDLPWVPKLRYRVMREYLPTRGKYALDMMLRTCTVQANLDYENVDDAFQKLRIGLRLQPIVAAAFASSPWVEGRATGERSRRLHVWSSVDPDRQGLLPQLWDGPAKYERYVEWALDAPMFLIKRGGTLHENTGQTFRAFLKDGFEGLVATHADWETHVNSLFPEARLKRTLEMRGADGQKVGLLPALPAIWKGLLYDAQTRARAEEFASRIHYDTLEAARPAIANDGLRAELQGRSLQDWAGELLELAESGLERIGALDAEGRDERVHLAPLRALLERGQTPADELLAALPDETPDPRALVEVARF